MSNLKSWTWRGVAAGTLAFGGLVALPSAAAAADPTTTPTFTKDVAPIFQAKCEACHRPDSIAPMSLQTYEESRPFARSIKTRVESRQMPPWHLDKTVGIQNYKNDRSLTDAQIDTIVRWVDGGSPKGNPADMPPAVKWPNEQGWNYAAKFGQTEPDLIIRSTPWTQHAGQQDAWWKPVVETGVTEPRWVRAIEIRPATLKGRKITHHAIAYLQQTEPDDLAQSGQAGLFMEWAVGKEGEMMRPDAGKLLLPGSTIRWDIHYSNGGEDITDVVEMGVYFYPKGQEPKYRTALGLYGTDRETSALDILPNTITMNEGFHVMRQAGRVESFQPHMHLRGKAMALEAILPNGQKQVLSYVPNFQFQWMNTYQYADDAAPLLPKGTILHVTSWHDNTSANKNNPDPDQWIGYGDRTVDEMAHAWINVTYMNDDDFAKEVEARRLATSRTSQQQQQQQ
jgi:hypothetical protein